MRQLGTLASEEEARRFTAYLVAQGIDAQADHDDHAWTIWVRDEDKRQQAREEFERFSQQPDDERYENAERQAEALLRARRQKFEQARRSVVEMRGRWKSQGPVSAGPRPPVTTTLVLISIAVTLIGWFGDLGPRSLGGGVYSVLQFADTAAFLKSGDAWVSLREGQIWRLVTPMFLHFHVAHIVFNMLLFYYFGKQIERQRGSLRLTALILIVSVAANVAQVAFKSPLFGGMSGVVYGLFGYVWMRLRIQPDSGFQLEPSMVVITLLWFALCFAEVIPNVANYAHAGGLLAGMLIGLSPWVRSRSYG